MSEIKALEKLREYAEQCCPAYEDYDARMMEIADAVEAEIAERFMELPCDADGVLIRCGDTVSGGMGDSGKVQHVEIWPDGFVVVYEHQPGQFTRYSNGAVHHVKPRTLEDMMTEYEELAANQNVKDYFEVSKELRTIQSEQFMDEPELELYKEVNGYRFYIELPYDELWIMTDKVEVKHHSYSYRYERPNGSTVINCSSLCGYPREWAIERLDEEIEEIRELMEVDR